MPDIKILVVDDEENILNIFRLALESNGYKVDTAATAHEALEKVKAGTFQVCLLDNNLPDMHGTELLRQIHQIDPAMKKLMVTGDWSPSPPRGSDGRISTCLTRANPGLNFLNSWTGPDKRSEKKITSRA